MEVEYLGEVYEKCSVCNKNLAVIFATQMINGKPEMKGLCIQCAKKMGILLWIS